MVNTVNSSNSTQIFPSQPTTIASVTPMQANTTQIHQTQINQIQNTQNQVQSVSIPSSTVVTSSNAQVIFCFN